MAQAEASWRPGQCALDHSGQAGTLQGDPWAHWPTSLAQSVSSMLRERHEAHWGLLAVSRALDSVREPILSEYGRECRAPMGEEPYQETKLQVGHDGTHL